MNPIKIFSQVASDYLFKSNNRVITINKIILDNY